MPLITALSYPPIADWDDAYANGAHIANADQFPPLWSEKAAAFRDAQHALGRAEFDRPYGTHPRETFDLFHPDGPPKGLFVFLHGGYWKAFDNKSWSHLARGFLEAGWRCALPSYPLCPDVSISRITRAVASALTVMTGGETEPVILAGHSAGGHLATRMMCEGGPLKATIQARLKAVLSISGVHDLRPLLNTEMNEILRLTPSEANEESPLLNWPATTAPLICLVGCDERPEFIRQSDSLAQVWAGAGLDTESLHMAGTHHFNVIDTLADPQSPLISRLLQAAGIISAC